MSRCLSLKTNGNNVFHEFNTLEKQQIFKIKVLLID